ncbi:MAG: arsenate reductase ArsC [Planctomycetota bacterium]|nr:MAG: arsenate reductase ArsC [Planctomycetota bacterium]
MKKKILFLCTGNSCRSQMAEALGKALKDDEYQFWSAGIFAKELDPLAMEVLEEVGISTNNLYSKNLDSLNSTDFDYVITLCGHADETCPFFPGPTQKLHIPFEDPPKLAANLSEKEEKKKIYRKIRDEIQKMILELEKILNEKS